MSESAEMLATLEGRNNALAALYSIALDLLNHRKVDEVLDRIIFHASELLDAPYGLFDLVEGNMLVIKYGTELAKDLIGHRLPIQEANITRLAVETRQPQVVDDYFNKGGRVKLHDPYQLRAACTFPIVINNVAVGAISLGRIIPGKPFTSEDVELMYSMAHLAGLALENANLFEETQKQSLTDALTGLANRRHFDSTLEEEWTRAKRIRKPLTLIMIDIDSFKKYNDTYGHMLGDVCIQQISQVLQRSARRAFDLAARYGGEEFSLILPGINLANARRMAEEIRGSVEALHISHETSETLQSVTISLGVAALVPAPESSALELITLADKALYKAKHTGKNRVSFGRRS